LGKKITLLFSLWVKNLLCSFHFGEENYFTFLTLGKKENYFTVLNFAHQNSFTFFTLDGKIRVEKKNPFVCVCVCVCEVTRRNPRGVSDIASASVFW
jgi:hypothetical protein